MSSELGGEKRLRLGEEKKGVLRGSFKKKREQGSAKKGKGRLDLQINEKKRNIPWGL